MAESPRAVFLSYAREDADAARRIAEALRSSGIEVWFDQNELRGGDAWDAKIRKQINDCTLFLPIISQHTQERNKGYFRLEWKLAVEQTHLMLEGVPFLAPVVIDDTTEAGAAVPAEFMRVQWTRLPGALPTPQFVAQVKKLLEAPQQSVGRDRLIPPPATPSAGFGDPALQKKSVPGWIWGAAAAVIVAVVAGVMLSRKPEPPATPNPATSASGLLAPHSSLPATSSDKSVAVLPFTNMSEEKDNAFFTDGIHEDILTNLALIRELRVVSRTSVMQYRGTTKTMKQLAEELGVTYILEGSVRRSGNKVRVTSQLIHAATDEHVWAQSYDRDLTDVFTIQSELSSQIAGALKAALSPEEKALIERRPTENTAAYDLFVKARERVARVHEGATSGHGSSGEREQEIETLLQAAVKLDPNFVDAWLALATAHGLFYGGNVDHSAARLAKAKAAIDRAVALAPDSPAVIASLGAYYMNFENNYDRAAEQFEKVIRLQPNSGMIHFNLGMLQRKQGRWSEALASLRKATQLDPAFADAASVVVLTLHQVRRFDEEMAERRRIVARWPERKSEAILLALLEDLINGTTRATDALIARFEASEADRPRATALRKEQAARRSDFAAFIRLDRQQPYFDGDGGSHYFQALNAAAVYFASGDAAAARARLENFPAELRKRLESEPTNPRLWQDVGQMEVILGHNEEAVRCARQAVDLAVTESDADRGPLRQASLAAVYAWTGDKDRAIAELTRLLRAPSFASGYVLRTSPVFFPLRGDPRFEALLNDPKNNAPLF